MRAFPKILPIQKTRTQNKHNTVEKMNSSKNHANISKHRHFPNSLAPHDRIF